MAGAFDGTLTLWNADTGERTLEFVDHHSQRIASIAFSRKRERMVSTSWANVNVWQSASGKHLTNVRQFAGFTSAAIAGDVLLASTEDKTGQVWDLKSGRPLRTLRGRSEVVANV